MFKEKTKQIKAVHSSTIKKASPNNYILFIKTISLGCHYYYYFLLSYYIKYTNAFNNFYIFRMSFLEKHYPDVALSRNLL
jgi:hypothetical protein